LQDSLALSNIRHVCRDDDDKEISEADYFSKLYEENYWTGFVVESVKSLMENDQTKNSVRQELIALYSEWTIEQLKQIDVEKNNIIEHEEGGHSYFPHTEFVKQSVVLLRPVLTDDLLLKLLKLDYSSFYSLDKTGTEQLKRQPLAAFVLEQIRDKDRLRTELIRNIKDPAIPYHVKSTHFKVCELLGYDECRQELYVVITGHKIHDPFDRVKLSEVYVVLGGKWADFSRLLAVPASPSYEKSFIDFQWHLLEKLLHAESEKAFVILMEVLEKDPVESNRLKAAEFLIKLSRIEGLRYWFDHIKDKTDMIFERRWESFYEYIRKMPFIDTVDILVMALDSIYQLEAPNLKDRGWRMDDTIFNTLVNLAIQGESQLRHIEEKITTLLEKTTYTSSRYTIKYYQDRVRSSYYQSITQVINIQEANKLYDKYLSVPAMV
jgi:hypothetical protein